MAGAFGCTCNTLPVNQLPPDNTRCKTPTSFTPKPAPVIINGQPYTLTAFYYPDKETGWDKVYQAPFLGNFYVCKLTLTINAITGTFHTAEAAFQCTKWWHDDSARQAFEQATTGNEAWHVKKGLHNPDMTYAGLGRDGAMQAVLMAKFSEAALQAGLLATDDSYLLEHNETQGRDDYWSDNNDGHGDNKLGITLMQVRAHYGGSDAPAGAYTVKAFTDQVQVR